MFIKIKKVLPQEELERMRQAIKHEAIKHEAIITTPHVVISNIDPALMEIIESRKDDIYSIDISKDGDFQIYFGRSNQ